MLFLKTDPKELITEFFRNPKAAYATAKKCRLKTGDYVLLKTKGGPYLARVTDNLRFIKCIYVDTDPFLWMHSWNYDQIEVLNKTQRVLYGA